MKAERLHNLVHDLNDEAKTRGLVTTLTSYHRTLAQSVSQPSTETSKAFGDAKAALAAAVEDSSADRLTPSYRRLLESIGGAHYFGVALEAGLERIIASHTATPGQAVTEVHQLVAAAHEYYATIETLKGALDKLGVDIDFTGEDQYEIGVVLPTALFKGNLEELNAELKLVDRYLRAFGELTSDDSSSPVIVAVADGSVDLFLQAIPEVASAVADAIEQIALIYLTILKIREHRRGLKESKISKEVLDAIDKDEKERTEKDIGALADKLFKTHRKKPDKTKDEEVKRKIEKALKYMAKRIDQGADFEVTGPTGIGEPDDDASDQERRKLQKKREAALELNARGASVGKLPPRSAEILSLPEPGLDKGDAKDH